MKNFLRVFSLIIINIIFTLTIIIFVSITNINGSINSTITSYAKTTIIDSLKDEVSEFEYPEDDEELNELADKYINIFIDGVVTGEVEDYNLKDDVINYLKNNKDELNEKYDLDIKDSDIEELENSDELDKLKDEINNTVVDVSNNVSSEYNWALNFIAFIRSMKFKIMCISIMVICLLLNALLMWSPYKWMLPTGIVSIVSGALTIINSIIMSLIAIVVASSSSVNINVNR